MNIYKRSPQMGDFSSDEMSSKWKEVENSSSDDLNSWNYFS